jgi:hypothetical protein
VKTAHLSITSKDIDPTQRHRSDGATFNMRLLTLFLLVAGLVAAIAYPRVDGSALALRNLGAGDVDLEYNCPSDLKLESPVL